MTEIRRKRDLETRVEYRPGSFHRPVTVRQFGGSRQRQEQQAAGKFNRVFHDLVREFGRRLAPPVDDELRDVRARIMARDIEALSFFEHDSVVEFRDAQ